MHEAKLVMKENVPKFCKARPVPYAIKEKIEEELVQECILQLVERTECIWAAPVLKPDQCIRICGT